MPELRAPRRRATAASALGGPRSAGAGRRAARASLSASSVRYSTGDLPSTRARNRPGSSAAARASSRAARLPVDAARGRRAASASKQARKPAAAGGVHRHFSSRWLRQKARSKAGSPYQAHSASRNTGPSRADQDVLRADVAVHQRDAWSLPCVATSASSAAARSGWRARGGEQVGLEADGVEDRVGRELGGEPRPRRRSRRGCAPARAPTAARGAGVGSPVAQRLLPQPVARRLEVAPSPARRGAGSWPRSLRGAAGRRLLAPPASSAPRRRCARSARASRPRRAACASARLTQTGPRRGVDPPDVGGDAAGQRPGR